VATYIDIDVPQGKVNGKPVMLRDLATTLDEIAAQPERYLCLLRNDDKGQYRYADFQSADPGASAGHVDQ
jgi:hypothetical protein